MAINNNIKNIILNAPFFPGVYKFIDANNRILYIGKAKNLKNRLLSYTQVTQGRIFLMLQRSNNLEYIVTKTENEALILEAKFISSIKPEFNILLKDDFSMSYLQINLEHEYPGISIVRKNTSNKNLLIGPFLSNKFLYNIVNELTKIFKIRNCLDSYFQNRKKPCMQYYIQKCSAPCVKKITHLDYNNNLTNLIEIITGKSNKLLLSLQAKMNNHTENLEYEQSAKIRDIILGIKELSQKYKSEFNIENADIINIINKLDFIIFQVFIYRFNKFLGNKIFVFNQHDYNFEPYKNKNIEEISQLLIENLNKSKDENEIYDHQSKDENNIHNNQVNIEHNELKIDLKWIKSSQSQEALAVAAATIESQDQTSETAATEATIESQAQTSATHQDHTIIVASQKQMLVIPEIHTETLKNQISATSQYQIISSQDHLNSNHLLNQVPDNKNDLENKVNIDQIFQHLILQYYQKNEVPDEIILDQEINTKPLINALKEINKNVNIFNPKRGNKFKALLFASHSAEFNAKEHIKQVEISNAKLQQIQKLFLLSKLPNRIEVYDNSHIMGSHPIGAMVAVINGKFVRSEYRKYHIKLEKFGGDDCAMLKEALTRRCKRILKSNNSPDLILIDGGKPQLSAAVSIIKQYNFNIPVIAIAKSEFRNKGNERFFLEHLEDPITLDNSNQIMQYLQNMRDEVHNLAISSHRKLRNKNAFKFNSKEKSNG